MPLRRRLSIWNYNFKSIADIFEDRVLSFFEAYLKSGVSNLGDSRVIKVMVTWVHFGR